MHHFLRHAPVVFGIMLSAKACMAGTDDMAPGESLAGQDTTAEIAFPGAVGYGRNATGWRGGEIYHVTTLENEGPGSLRDCAEHDRPARVCVFDISGTIVVDDQIRVSSNTYIAGQTAPGEGVQIRLGDGRSSPLMIFEAHDVLLRNLKFRPGASREPSSNVDALAIESSSNIYVDRVSAQFATDENLSLGTEDLASEDITIARSITSLSLDKANHPRGRHSKGALLCADDGSASMCGRVTLYGNLFAHNRDRNPDIASSPAGPVDIVNNVFYDATSQFGEFRNLYGDTWISYVGNVVLPGPSTRETPPPVAFQVLPFGEEQGFTMEVYEHDNLHLANQMDMLCDRSRNRPIADDDARAYLVSEPRTPLSVSPLPSAVVYESVLTDAGARHGPERQLDRLDAAVIENVRSCQGGRINDPSDVGGWPDLAVERGAPDSDGDGMPDAWEEAREGLDPGDPSDTWQDRDSDGWSNIEEYLSYLAGDPMP
ncbi:pectate lyase family protein [Aurantiacibacter hainanensis]|uniref:pectate lyase family protein n=1 Tax=Aurantiacibacter hainanensis TaxID=3076114 RepID=UPI0030C7175E